jgi:hypothetical protein
LESLEGKKKRRIENWASIVEEVKACTGLQCQIEKRSG